MNRFIYFIPGVPGCNEEMLAARGLLSRLSGPGGIVQHGITAWRDGPDGNGVAIAVTCEPARYEPETQVWQEGPQFHTGMDANARPTPADVERELGYNGHEVRLLDGNMWRVPLLRRWDDEKREHISALPKVLRSVKDANGRFGLKLAVAKSHEKIDELAETIWQAFLTKMTWSTDLLFQTAAQLLSQNYRIGIEEIGLLGLLDEPMALAVLGLAIDTPGLESAAAMMAEDGLHFMEEVHG